MTAPDSPDLSALSPLAPALASTIASLAGDVALVLDSEGVIHSVADGASQAASACAGWVGRRWVDTATDDTRSKLERLLADVRSSGVARRREVNHPAPEGEAIPLAWSALRLGDSGAVIAVGRDLRAVAAIQQSFLDTQQELERAYWQRRQDASRDEQLRQWCHEAVFLLDAPTLHLLEVNDAALTLLERPREGVVGRPMTELLPGLARAAVGGLLAAACSRGHAGEIRVRLDEGGDSLGWAATPFSARHGRRVLLRARRAIAADAVADPMTAVLVVDGASRVQTATASALHDLCLVPASQVKGRPLTDLLAPHEAAPWLALVEQARASGLVARVPLDGGRDAPAVTAALLTDSDQESVGLSWTARGGPRHHGATPAEMLRQLAAQLGQAPLRHLLTLGRDELERHLVSAALWRSGGSAEAAALLLGISQERLVRRLKRLGLPAPRVVD